MITVRRLLRDRYVVLSAAVFVVLVAQTVQRQWSSDIWEHAAVIRELAARPLHPLHPMVATGDPHPFFSPWALAVGLFARVTGLAPLDALAVVAPLNLLLVLTGLRAFVRRVSRHRQAPFYALLFVLLLWGPSPWRFSGFLNLNSIGFVLPYPSTFAIGACLWGLALFDRSLDRIVGPRARPGFDTHPTADRHTPPMWSAGRTAAAGIGLTLLSAVVLLTHPVDVITLYGGFLALAVVRGAGALRSIGFAVAAIIGSVLLGVVWPYYPLIETARSHAFDTHLMYDQALFRLLPIVVVGVPALVWRARRDPRDPLGVFAAGLAFLYLLGWVAGRESLGRDVSTLALVLQIASADLVAGYDGTARAWLRGAPPVRRAIGLVSIMLITVLALINVSPGLVRAVPRSVLPSALRPHISHDEQRFGFLEQITRDRQVVIAERQTGRVVPVYGGRVVAPYHPFALVADPRRRVHDLEVFFRPTTSTARRAAIARRWHARYLLIDTQQYPVTSPVYRSLMPLTRSLRLVHGGSVMVFSFP